MHDTSRAQIRNGPTLDYLLAALANPDNSVMFVIGPAANSLEDIPTSGEVQNLTAGVDKVTRLADGEWEARLTNPDNVPRLPFLRCWVHYRPGTNGDTPTPGTGTLYIEH